MIGFEPFPSGPLRVAIIGGGPGGLGAAIALSALPNVEVNLYEQARELREIGAGINIGYNCWRVLELLGAAQDVKGHLGAEVLHRNGLNGNIVRTSLADDLPLQYQSRRVRRPRLQAALVGQVPDGVIHLRKRLLNVEDMGIDGVKLNFDDETSVVADLLVGGDGIRSAVRQAVFPDHSIQFTGTTIWRVLIPLNSVSAISDITPHVSWWHGPSGHFYASLVDDDTETAKEEQLFEIAARYVQDPTKVTEEKFSWGVPSTNERVESHFTDYDPRVREALSKVPEGGWREFSAFAGPRLERLVAWGKVVLIGDASHPLSGAFGSGAAFALEDGWILAQSIQHARSTGGSLIEALTVFDEIRSPYYIRMYEHLDAQKKRVQDVKTTSSSQDFNKILPERIAGFGTDKLNWIYRNDIEKVWETYLEEKRLCHRV